MVQDISEAVLQYRMRVEPKASMQTAKEDILYAPRSRTLTNL